MKLFSPRTARRKNDPRYPIYLGVAALLSLCPLVSAQSFPPIGGDTGPGITLVINVNGTISVIRDQSQPPYDGTDDTYMAVINNSAQTIQSIQLQSPNPIFEFDGDGFCSVSPSPPGCPFPGTTGYEGPIRNSAGTVTGFVSFSNINLDTTSGRVDFNPPSGLPPGGSAYFALENAIETTCAPLSVPSLKQGCGQSSACPNVPCPAAPWTCTTYAHCLTDTISKSGCNLTSCVMIINYQASEQGVPFSTTPDQLNAWLNQQMDGWNAPCGGPNRYAVARYAQTNGVSLWYQGDKPGANDFSVDSYLCANNPVILWVRHNGTQHFVVATGQTAGAGKYLINDPGFPHADLSAYNSTYDGMFPFSSTPAPNQALLITAHSPVELIITDQSGQQTGMNPATGQTFNDIPDGSYTHESIGDDENPASGVATPDTKVLNLAGSSDGRYRVSVHGTGAGAFSVDFFGYDSNGNPSMQTVTGMATLGSIIEYDVDYSSIPGSGISVTPAAPKVATPAILPPGGTFRKKVTVTMSCATPGATIHYTTNGSDPTAASAIYNTGTGKKKKNKGIKLTGRGQLTIKAIAVKAGDTDSDIAVANFTLN
jgi:hypothetical protein